MFRETIMIGLGNFFSPGSIFASLILCAVLLFFGKDIISFCSIGVSYIISFGILYFLTLQNGLSYIRYEILGDAYLKSAYLFFSVSFLALGLFFFKEWVRVSKDSNAKLSVIIRFENQVRLKIANIIAKGLISAVLATVVAFLSIDTVDNRDVLQSMINATAAHDQYAYYGVIFVYLSMLLLPLCCVYWVVSFIRKKKRSLVLNELRLLMICFSAIYIGAGLSLVYLM